MTEAKIEKEEPSYTSEEVTKRASEAAIRAINILKEDCMKETNNGAPDDQINVTCLASAIILSSVVMTLDGFGKTYGIEKLTSETSFNYICRLTVNILEQNKIKVEEKVH